jgi:4-hydroxybenzoate polyprenyltransferase
MAQRIGNHEVTIDGHVALTGLAVCLFTLLIRVMDEFKDYHDDLTNFPTRPLPSRRVRFFDLQVLGWCCVGMSLLISSWSVPSLLACLAVLGYSFLMLKWFFNEQAVRKSLPLAFLTHHPIVIFHAAYLLVVSYVSEYNTDIFLLASLLPLSFVGTNWEISRKIRQPSDETVYTTYSKIWGPRLAVIITIILQLIVLITGIHFIEEIGHSDAWTLGFGLVYLLTMVPALYFLLTLRLLCPLRKSAEGQILWVVVFLLAAAWVP